ncbi:elongation factor G [Streptomyces odonnellii]|uniref:elongation factor G n=1 Tax=Streptomyces odonnellii TaxID=1417980 RepID=UPI0006263F04|nr:TetM/TetW/TetO/TetS family tetracycline resistance ribosomal protection protein [Streptomyces odonnellii]
MRTLNLGILAHVDAGKTSLTERLLHAAGVIDEIGSVDDGSTQTDSLTLERQRGITIKSAVVSFVVDGVTVNLIDTPGHPDFIAEVERVLNVLDGAVLVISAVEGVQAQTRVLMRTLRRLRIPTLIFVNKIDRRGAHDERVLRAVSERLSPAIVPMGAAYGLGARGAGFTPFGEADDTFTAGLAEVLADHDDALMAAYLDDGTPLPYRRLRDGLAAQTGRALVHPVYFGSAITGAGVDALITGITELLPASERDTEGAVSGTVFKIERGTAGEKIAYVRMVSGTVRTRDKLLFGRHGAGGAAAEGKVTAISVFDQGAAVSRSSVEAGRIGLLRGLGDIRIGDTIGDAMAAVDAADPPGSSTAQDPSGQRHFAPPTLETVVVPRSPADKGALHEALAQLVEQDPLINLRQDAIRQEISVSLYGEVQKEVIQATLANDFGVHVTFRETTTICVERPAGSGEALEIMGKDPNPFLATIGLRVEPAPHGSGVEFRREIELGSLPLAFLKAIEETVKQTLLQGIHGWQVIDCAVTLTRSGYAPRQSHAHAVFDKSMSSTGGDFRSLTPLVLMAALKQAGTMVYEPMHRFRLELPADVYGSALPVLARLRAVPRTPSTHGSSYLLEGEIPAAQVHELEQRLPTLTRGEGVLESAFDHYQQVTGPLPSRPRTDHDPLNRKEYLLRVVRRVAG